MIECPKCKALVEVIDRNSQWVTDEDQIIEYKCLCIKCGFEGTYSEVLRVIAKEWDNVE